MLKYAYSWKEGMNTSMKICELQQYLILIKNNTGPESLKERKICYHNRQLVAYHPQMMIL